MVTRAVKEGELAFWTMWNFWSCEIFGKIAPSWNVDYSSFSSPLGGCEQGMLNVLDVEGDVEAEGT